MTIFGDIEPEDAWDAGDTISEQLRNLIRRVELLMRHPVRVRTAEPGEALAALRRLVARARRRRLYGRELLRAAQLDEDIAYVESRL